MIGAKSDTVTDIDLIPFATYIRTHTSPIHKNGMAYWPRTTYYKDGYYPQINHEAICSIYLTVKENDLSGGLQLWLDCTFGFL
ncbi:MAG TPA: hypothetical protein VLF69_06265 [Candidatus Saccharimonadales bacterium]|nr:hypothetical protein [Candidatus Saccharimonadales bacterium]